MSAPRRRRSLSPARTVTSTLAATTLALGLASPTAAAQTGAAPVGSIAVDAGSVDVLGSLGSPGAPGPDGPTDGPTTAAPSECVTHAEGDPVGRQAPRDRASLYETSHFPSATTRSCLPVGDEARAEGWTSWRAVGENAVAITWWGTIPTCVASRYVVRESARAVSITVETGGLPGRETDHCTMQAVATTATIPLAAPLGSRVVLDGARR